MASSRGLRGEASGSLGGAAPAHGAAEGLAWAAAGEWREGTWGERCEVAQVAATRRVVARQACWSG